MIVKDIRKIDWTNYKEPSMVIVTARCTMKCNVNGGECQNRSLLDMNDIVVPDSEIVSMYLDSVLTGAIVFSGLEPFDQYEEMLSLIKAFRKVTSADIVIYTGYEEDEIWQMVDELSEFKNIVIKFGRYKPGDAPHLDRELGVMLASDNQYAKRVS